MTHNEYIIIGGGMTADAAIAGIHQIDPDAFIGLFSMEKHSPYNRMPLCKGLWKGKTLEKICRQASKEGVDLHLGRTFQAVHPANHHVSNDQGEIYTYSKLLLATGSSPPQLPFGGDRVFISVIWMITFNCSNWLRRVAGLVSSGAVSSALRSLPS